jgi:hypothetical protein
MKIELNNSDWLVDKNMPAVALASTSSRDRLAKLNVPSSANRMLHAAVQIPMADRYAFNFCLIN